MDQSYGANLWSYMTSYSDCFYAVWIRAISPNTALLPWMAH